MGTIALTTLPSDQTATSAVTPIIEAAESLSSVVYPDNGYPDIGYGIQLNATTLPLILVAMGVPDSWIDVATQAALTALKAPPGSWNTALNQDVGRYLPQGQTFSLSPTQAYDALQLILTDVTIPGLNTRLNNNGAGYLATSAGNNTQQYVALLDMYYNTPKLIGPNLLGALASGNRAQAWFEIRYGSNGNQLAGLAARHYYDSQLFGLFSNPTAPSESEVLQAYEMLTANRKTIITYEAIYGVDPDAPTLASASNSIATANTQFGLSGSNQVQTLAQTFSPAETVILQMLAADSPLLQGLAANWAAPTDIFVASCSDPTVDVSTGDPAVFVPNGSPPSINNPNSNAINSALSLQLSEADFLENEANHILIGMGDGQTLIGGFGNDILVAGSGSETLQAGVGDDTLIAGGGNDTVVLGGVSDTVDFEFANQTGLTETVLVNSVTGSDSIDIGGAGIGSGMTQSGEDVWQDSQGNTYTFSSNPGTPPPGYSGPALGQNGVGELVINTQSGNTIDIWGFSLPAAYSPTGFLGITIPETSPVVSFGATEAGASPDPAFAAGSTQSYTVTVGAPSDVAQTMTLALSGAPAADFGLDLDGGDIQDLNSDGTFAVTIPAGQTSASFALTNTADVGGNATLELTASLPDGNTTVTSAPLTQSFDESSTTDPFATPPPATLYSYYTDYLNYPNDPYDVIYDFSGLDTQGYPGTPTVAGSGLDLIVAEGNNEAVEGGTGSDLITEDFGDSGFYDTQSGSAELGYAAPGTDQVVGNGGTDVIWDTTVGPETDVQVYADQATSLASAIQAAQANTATGQQGDVIATGILGIDNSDEPPGPSNPYEDGEPANTTVVGGTGNDLIINGQANTVVVAGSGDDTIVGGVWLDSSVPPIDLSFFGPDVTNWSVSSATPDSLMVNNLFPDYNFGSETPQNLNDVYAVGAIGPGYEGNVTTGPALYNTDTQTWSQTGQYAYGDGNETIYGGAGASTILLSNGNNYVDLGTGDSSVYGGMGNNTIFGGTGDVYVQGGGGNDYIDAGSGNDVLMGRGGNNTILGGCGDDTIFAGSPGTSSDPQSWATSETGNNYVDGGSGKSVIFGAGGADTLIAGTGNSTVYGGAGAESITGGSGTDLLVGGSGNDTIDAGGDGSDTLVGQALSGSTSYLYGGDGTDFIQGDPGTDVLDAGDGGTVGAATSVVAGSGDATVYGGDGVDIIQGGSGSDVLYTGDGGTEGAATSVVAGSGNTTVYGGTGLDVIQGGSGSDVLYAGDGGTDSNPTTVVSGTGTATLDGGAGSAVLEDIVNGDDLLVAGSGDDTLIGSGNDTLQAGSGIDYLNAGSGNETYVFDSDFGDSEVSQSGGSATLEFGSGIQVSDLTVTVGVSDSGEAALDIYGDGGSLLVDGGLSGLVSGVTFEGSGSYTLEQLIQQDGVDQTLAGANGSLIFSADEGISLTTGSGADTISAWGDDDSIAAAAGNTAGVTLFAGGDASSVTGAEGSDSLTASGSNDTLTAGSGNAQLLAAGSDALLNAGSGDDTLTAQATGDTLVGGAGNDEFVVDNSTAVVDVGPGGGSDSVVASVSYTLPAYVDTLTFTGSSDLSGTGNDDPSNTLTANAGNDTLTAGSGADTLVAGSGIDTLIGGGGGDTFDVNNASDVVEEPFYGSNDTINSSVSYTLPTNVDTLKLTGSADLTAAGNSDTGNTLVGNSGDDALIAGSGHDTLVAGIGVDTLIGGGGGDTFVVDNTADVVSESTVGAEDTVDAAVNYTLPTNVDTLVLTGSANLTGIGNGDAANTITGNAGNDSLVAGSGSDTLLAGSGTDTLVAGGGSDLLEGTTADTYVLNAGFGDVEIDGGGGGTVQFGPGVTASSLTLSTAFDSSGNPSLVISSTDGGSATIDGALSSPTTQFQFAGGPTLSLEQLLSQISVSSDTVSGPNGNLILNSDADASIAGGTGSDTIYAAGAGDTVIAGSGNQTLIAVGNDEVLAGGPGADSLCAGAGSVVMIGGTGATTMNAGTGTDTYQLTAGATVQINTSANEGVGIISLPQGMSLSDFTAYQSGEDLILQSLSGNTTATIQNYFTSASNSPWFIESQTDAPELLQYFVDGMSTTTTSDTTYQDEVNQLSEAYSANLTAQLQALGAAGGSLGTLIDLRGENIPVQYTFNGVSNENLSVTGGSISLPSSEIGEDTLETHSTTYTDTYPTYTLENFVEYGYVPIAALTVPNGGVELPPGAEPVYQSETVPGSTTPENVLVGYDTETSTWKEVQTGTQTNTYTVSTDSDVSTRSFVTYDVTGDGGNDTITAAGPFTGTVVTGNGNVYVNLGTTSGNGAGNWISGDVPGTSTPLFPSGSPQYEVQPGAFIEAGSGNDTLIGTNGDDVMAAGTGFDYMDGGNGANTYLVPMQGYSTDVIYNSGNPAPDISSLLVGGTSTDLGGDSYDPDDPEQIFETQGPGQFPLSTLQLPTGITLSNLQYRLFTSPEFPGDDVLQLNSGNSNILIAFQPSPVYTDLRVAYVNYVFNPITTPAQLGVSLIQFADGTTLTLDQLMQVATELPNNVDPTVTAQSSNLQAGEPVAAASLFSASDSPGNAITWYQISNAGTGGGYFALDGQAEAVGQSFMVNAGQLSQLVYVAGSAGSSDSVQVSAFDGAVWSNPVTETVNVGASNSLQATAANQVVTGNSSGPDTLTGGYSGDTLVGSSGNDTFAYASGSGAETVWETAPTTDTSNNTLQFGAGITPSAITLSETGDPGLVLSIGGGGDSVTIDGFDPMNPLGSIGVQYFDFADGTSLSLLQLLSDPSVTGGSGTLTNPDGSTTTYDFTPGADQLYSAETVDPAGQVTASFVLNSDGSTTASTYNYNADGSYSDTVVATAADGGGVTTTVYSYDPQGQLLSENVTNPDGSTAAYTYNTAGETTAADIAGADGSTSNSTYVYNADGSYTDSVVSTPAGGSATTTVYGYNTAGQLISEDVQNPDGSTAAYGYDPQGQLLSADVTNADGSTSDSTYSYNADGTYTDSVVTASEAGGATTTTVYAYDAQGQLLEEDVSNPDGSTADYTYTTQGQMLTADLTAADGSTNNSAWTYSADGSYSDTVISTPAGGSATTTVYGYNAEGNLLSENVTNPDSSTADYTYTTQGQIVTADLTAADGSTNDSTWTYSADGSYTDTVISTPAGGSATTTVYGYNAEGNLLSENVTNPDSSTADYTYTTQGQIVTADLTAADGSTNNSTWTYSADGSYSDTAVSTPAGGSATTTVYGYNAEGNLLSENVTNPDSSTADYTYTTQGQIVTADLTAADGSTNNSTWTYNADGSYADTVISTPVGSGATTSVYDYSATGSLLNENAYSPSANGTYTDSWSAQGGSDGSYWWNATTGEYLDTWYNADGSYFTDEYQYASGGSPASTGYSFTETYSASDGDTGTRQYDASTGVTSVTWDSASTGMISGTITDSSFIGLQNQGELTNTEPDLTFFNPSVSPSFSAFLTAHG